MSLESGARLTLRVPPTKPEIGNRQVLPLVLVGVPTVAPVAAAPLKTMSVASTPTTASEKVTSTLTLLAVIFAPLAGLRVCTEGVTVLIVTLKPAEGPDALPAASTALTV